MHLSKIDLVKVLFCIVTLLCGVKGTELKFNIAIADVSFKNALFKIIDDNSTPTNYLIKYTLKSHYDYVDKYDILVKESENSVSKFEIQVNSLKALAPVNETGSNRSAVDATFWDNGVMLTPEEVKNIQFKTPDELHTFVIDKLDENRYYKVTFDVIASLAQSRVFKSEKYFDTRRTVKKFQVNFKTRYDVVKAAELACQKQIAAEKDRKISALAVSYYQAGTNCTKCSEDSYQVKEFESSLLAANGPILCQRCPCDKKKSTGLCSVIYPPAPSDSKSNDMNKYIPELTIKCNKCIKPFTGEMCADCESEGVDFYKSSQGTCEVCQCSGNSAYDNTDFNQHTRENQWIKCERLTGKCVDCMFNTTGNTCNECKKGFHGNPLKRTCKQMIPTEFDSFDKITYGKFHEVISLQYSSKKFMFFYMCCLSLIVLISYLLINKYRKQYPVETFPKSDNLFGVMLKSSVACCGFLGEVTRELFSQASFYFYLLCPNRFKSPSSPSRINNPLHRGVFNDDDRMNLAEYQVYDENALFEANPNKRAEYDESEDIMHSGKNPYRELTMKC